MKYVIRCQEDGDADPMPGIGVRVRSIATIASRDDPANTF